MRAASFFRTCAFVAFALAATAASAAQPTAPAPADATVTPGEFVIEHPTLINLGFEWHIDGDANRNASVDVSFRKPGETAAWRKALPLARLHGEQVFQRNVFNLVTPNMFAGSILDLEPGTSYEARFVMTDPDGVNGAEANATKIVTVRTRPEPVPATGGKTYHVYPTKWAGPKSEPAFEGIMCAYNYCGAGDTAPGGRPRVKPGDTILVHAGTYAYHYEFYGNNTQINATTTFEGTYYLTADGTPDKPIVIKAAGDGEVIIDGRGNFNLVNVKAADYNYFEGITFRNTQIAIWAGTQFIAGSKGLTVKRCRYSSSDYNGFRPNPGDESFQWNSPPLNVSMIPADGTGGAKLEARKFATLEAYAQATRQDQHSVLVDYDIFKKVTKLDAKDLATVQRLYKADDLDFSLRPGSAAVDRGVALPNVTDGFTGPPDLGALEVGRPLPVYGPRPR